MTRFCLLVVSILFALFSTAHAKGEENKVTLYAFSNDNCAESPPGGDLDVFLDTCYSLPMNAKSVKPIIDPERQHWIDDVNNDLKDCTLVLYSGIGCNSDQKVGSAALPEHLSSCVKPGPKAAPLSSVRFECARHSKPAEKPYTGVPGGATVITTTHTSWQVGTYDQKPTPFTTALTITVSDAGLPLTSTDPPAPARTPLDTPDRKGLWMLHPWSRSVLCYDCYLYHSGDTSKFDCRSGPDHNVECGDLPDINENQSVTVTETSSVTVTVQAGSLPSSRANFTNLVGNTQGQFGKRRSWRRDVIFNHPFIKNTRVCAQAEWEERGQETAEIRLQKTGRNMNECKDAGAQSINLPDPYTATVRFLKTVWVKTLVLSSTTTTVGPSINERRTHVPNHVDL